MVSRNEGPSAEDLKAEKKSSLYCICLIGSWLYESISSGIEVKTVYETRDLAVKGERNS